MMASFNPRALTGRITESRMMRSAGLMAGAAVLGQLMMLAAMPLLTRLYDPSDFGVFAIFSAMMGLVLVISSLRYEMAIPLMRNDKSAGDMLISVLAINAISALASLLAVVIWRHDIADLVGAPAVAKYLFMLPIGLLGAGSFRAFNLLALRQNRFVVVAQTKLVQSLSNVAFQIAAGLTGLGAIGLITGHILGFSAGVVRLARDAALRMTWPGCAAVRRSASLLKGHDRFPKFDVPAALIDFLGVQLPNLVLAALFSPTVAGIYFLADRVLTAPMSIVSQAVSQALLAGARASLARGTLLRQTVRMGLGLAAMVALPALVIVMAGEPLFAMVFDDSWRQAGVYAAWLVPGFCVQFIYSSISTALTATRGQKVNLVIHASLLALKVLALWIGYNTGSPLNAIIGLSVVNFVGGGFAVGLVLTHIALSGRRAAARRA